MSSNQDVQSASDVQTAEAEADQNMPTEEEESSVRLGNLDW